MQQKDKWKTLVGQKRGHLTLIGDTGKRTARSKIVGLFKCDHDGIGEPGQCEVVMERWISGNTKSCGCARRAILSEASLAISAGDVNAGYRVLELNVPYGRGNKALLCECVECLRRYTVTRFNFLHGKGSGCRRCTMQRVASSRPALHGHARRGGENRMYDAWSTAKLRGRLDAEWHTFSAFLRDVGERPSGHIMGRPDPLKPYGPRNFLWRPASSGVARRVVREAERAAADAALVPGSIAWKPAA